MKCTLIFFQNKFINRNIEKKKKGVIEGGGGGRWGGGERGEEERAPTHKNSKSYSKRNKYDVPVQS